MTVAVDLRAVHARRGGRAVLGGVSLRIARGERVALLGANGVGKSTLLDVIVGLTAPSAGAATVLPDLGSVRRVGLVSQDPDASLLPWLSVAANIELPLRVAGASGAERSAALERVRVRFDPTRAIPLDRSPATLSGGQRQIVALMRAFVGAPQLVVGDEPLSAVDLVARLRLREAMLASCREDDATFVFVTHDLGDVAALATRALVLAGQPAVLTADLAVVGSDTRALERALREPVAECPGDAPPSPRLARLTGALA